MGSIGRAIAAAVAILSTAPSALSAAQAGPAPAAELPGAIVVQVTDTSLNPLPAEVTFPELGLSVQLSAEGTALFVDVPDGVYLVKVRHEGHAPDARLLRVVGDTVRVEFVLPPATDDRGKPAALAAGTLARARLRYFLERGMTIERGVFVTRNEIERRGARTVGALLRELRDVRVERVAEGRTIVRSAEASGPACARGMLVFVDGIEMVGPDGPGSEAAEPRSRSEHPRSGARRLTAGSAGQSEFRAVRWVGPTGGDLVRVARYVASASETTTVHGLRTVDVDRIKASSVAAVEVYSSPRSVPPEFQMPGAECGVVLIWTAAV